MVIMKRPCTLRPVGSFIKMLYEEIIGLKEGVKEIDISIFLRPWAVLPSFEKVTRVMDNIRTALYEAEKAA